MNLIHALHKIVKKTNYQSENFGKTNKLNRDKWLENTLKKIPNGNKILDAGAGELQYKRYCDHLEYESQDFAEYVPDEIDTGIQKKSWDYGVLDIISDIADIPRNDKSFDAIMCVEVLEHIVNPREAIKEFSRLLKKDGSLIITAPFCSLTHFAPYHFYSGFNSFFYETTLKENGFQILEIIPNGNYFEYLAQELNRLNRISKRYSSTKLSRTELKQIKQLKVLLKRLSEKDIGSSEMLCYGYHVLARKI